tara:strand:+ start:38 stop:955 length:918 start_codon:yes stop_codon:yes gene_type:complete
MEEKPNINKNAFHLAGIIPVSGHTKDFGFQWDNVMMPIAENYTAIERSVMECAYAGCETIWIVCNKDMQPLIRYRIGEMVQDPVWYGRVLSAHPEAQRKQIPIYYVAIHPKDRDRIDCYAWSILHGANTAYWVSKQMSTWLTPDKYYVSFPLSVYPENAPRKYRAKISSENNFFFCYNDKTVKDGQYLGFSFGPQDFIESRRVIRKEGTKQWKNSGTSMPTEKLPLEERWSARYFSLDKVFEPVIIIESNVKELEWFHDLSSWENYSNFFASEESKQIKRPYEGLFKYHEWSGLGVENDNKDNDD